MKSGIYKIINKVNGKYYVGSSKSPHERWMGHRRKLLNKIHINEYLQHAWNKYGEKNFEFIIVEEVSINRLLIVEQKYLDIAKKDRRKTYNMSFIAAGGEQTDEIKDKMRKNHADVSGKNNPNFGKKWSSKIKRKISIARKKFYKENPEKILRGTSHPMWRTHPSKETLLKMSKVTKGKNNPAYDHKIYYFYNKRTNENFNGTRFDFRTKYNLQRGHIYDLIKGIRKSVKGWITSVHHYQENTTSSRPEPHSYPAYEDRLD